jgi:hypothetical protein
MGSEYYIFVLPSDVVFLMFCVEVQASVLNKEAILEENQLSIL